MHPYTASLIIEILHLAEGGYEPQMDAPRSSEWLRHFEYLEQARAIAPREGSSPACYHITESGRRMLGRLHSAPRTIRTRPRRSRA